MMIKNLVVKIQNLVVNHESQLVKLNPVYVYAYMCVCVRVCVCVCVYIYIMCLCACALDIFNIFFVTIFGLTCV